MWRVRVFHDYYGCDTGCCGHTVMLTGDDDTERSHFEFMHPNGEVLASWAREHAEETIRREWPECLDTIDWTTMDIEEATDNC